MPATTKLRLADLTSLSSAELHEAFLNGDVGEPPSGSLEGLGLTAGPVGGSLSAAVLRTAVRALVWRGKSLDPQAGTSVNLMTPFRLRLGPARTRIDSGVIDARPSLFVDFRPTTGLPIHDEVRQVGPGLYLGLTFVGSSPAAFFALWPSVPEPSDYFRNKVAVVTGGASGFGRALVQDLAGRGAHVVIADLDEVKAKSVAAEVEAAGGSAEAHGLDVTSVESFAELVDEVIRTRGRVDLLFNNAGIQVGGEHHEVDLVSQLRMVDINVEGVLHGIESVYARMVEQGSGQIVNTASVAGLTPVPLGAVYSATKHFVVGLSASLRSEAADLGVRVNVVCPGPMRTPFWDAPTVGYDKDKMFATFAFRDLADPVDCARKALDSIAHDEGIILVGGPTGRLVWAANRLSPRGYLVASRYVMRNFRGNRLED